MVSRDTEPRRRDEWSEDGSGGPDIDLDALFEALTAAEPEDLGPAAAPPPPSPSLKLVQTTVDPAAAALRARAAIPQPEASPEVRSPEPPPPAVEPPPPAETSFAVPFADEPAEEAMREAQDLGSQPIEDELLVEAPVEDWPAEDGEPAEIRADQAAPVVISVDEVDDGVPQSHRDEDVPAVVVPIDDLRSDAAVEEEIAPVVISLGPGFDADPVAAPDPSDDPLQDPFQDPLYGMAVEPEAEAAPVSADLLAQMLDLERSIEAALNADPDVREATIHEAAVDEPAPELLPDDTAPAAAPIPVVAPPPPAAQRAPVRPPEQPRPAASIDPPGPAARSAPIEPPRKPTAVDLDDELWEPGWFVEEPTAKKASGKGGGRSALRRYAKPLLASAAVVLVAGGIVLLKVGIEPVLVAGEGLIRLVRDGVQERPRVFVEEPELPAPPDILARLPNDLRQLLTSPEAGTALVPFRFGFAITPDAFCRSMADNGFPNYGWLPIQEGAALYECMSDLVQVPNPNGAPLSEPVQPSGGELTLLGDDAAPVPAPQPLYTTVFFAARGTKVAMDTIRFKLNVDDPGVRAAAYDKLFEMLDRAGKTIAWTPPEEVEQAIRKRQKLIGRSRGVYYQILPEGGPVERINVVLTLKEPPEILPTVLLPRNAPQITIAAPDAAPAPTSGLVAGVVPMGQDAPTAEERRLAAAEASPVLSEEIDETGLRLWQPSVESKPLVALAGTEPPPGAPTTSPGAAGLPIAVAEAPPADPVLLPPPTAETIVITEPEPEPVEPAVAEAEPAPLAEPVTLPPPASGIVADTRTVALPTNQTFGVVFTDQQAAAQATGPAAATEPGGEGTAATAAASAPAPEADAPDVAETAGPATSDAAAAEPEVGAEEAPEFAEEPAAGTEGSDEIATAIESASQEETPPATEVALAPADATVGAEPATGIPGIPVPEPRPAESAEQPAPADGAADVAALPTDENPPALSAPQAEAPPADVPGAAAETPIGAPDDANAPVAETDPAGEASPVALAAPPLPVRRPAPPAAPAADPAAAAAPATPAAAATPAAPAAAAAPVRPSRPAAAAPATTRRQNVQSAPLAPIAPTQAPPAELEIPYDLPGLY